MCLVSHIQKQFEPSEFPPAVMRGKCVSSGEAGNIGCDVLLFTAPVPLFSLSSTALAGISLIFSFSSKSVSEIESI